MQLQMCPMIYFNPLPRKEGDMYVSIYSDLKGISIHSLVKRETEAEENGGGDFKISIHSLVKRETMIPLLPSPKPSISIHSLVKRETHDSFTSDPNEVISIHSLVKRETLTQFTLHQAPDYFNPLPRKEGDFGS